MFARRGRPLHQCHSASPSESCAKLLCLLSRPICLCRGPVVVGCYVPALPCVCCLCNLSVSVHVCTCSAIRRFHCVASSNTGFREDKGRVKTPSHWGRRIRSSLGAHKPHLGAMPPCTQGSMPRPATGQEFVRDSLEGACPLEVGQWVGLHIWAHFLQLASRSAQVQEVTTRSLLWLR